MSSEARWWDRFDPADIRERVTEVNDGIIAVAGMGLGLAGADVAASTAYAVIVISALSDDLDKLSALRIGADDYVTKPFNPKEVVARVEAVLRRTVPAPARMQRLGNLSLDPEAHRVSVAGRALSLTLSEYRLLAGMMRHPDRVHSRADLLDACLEESDALERTIDSHVSNLRRKLVQAGAEVMPTTVRGVGYRLEFTTCYQRPPGCRSGWPRSPCWRCWWRSQPRWA